MNRKFLDISATHRAYGGPIKWVKSIPAHNFNVMSVNGVDIAAIERTYYLDQKTGKVRYQGHDCSNASYDHLYSLFAEVYPGLFVYMGICSEDNLTDALNRHSARARNFSDAAIEEYRNSVVRYGA